MRQALKLILMSGVANFASAFGTVPLNAPGYDPAFAFGKSFFDPRRIHMSQSLSFGLSSGSLGRQSGGLYLNRISLDLSRSLQLQVDMGMSQLFYSSSPQLIQPDQKPQMVLPHVGLEYQSHHFTLGIHYYQLDPNTAVNSSLLNPWSRRSPW